MTADMIHDPVMTAPAPGRRGKGEARAHSQSTSRYSARPLTLALAFQHHIFYAPR